MAFQPYAPDGGILGPDNGVALHWVEWEQDNVPGVEVVTVRMMLVRTAFFISPFDPDYCEHVVGGSGMAGKRVLVEASVNGEKMTEREYCVAEDPVGSQMHKPIDVPVPEGLGLGTHWLSLYFHQAGSDAPQFSGSHEDMPQSTLELPIVITEQDDGDNGDGGNGDNGDGGGGGGDGGVDRKVWLAVGGLAAAGLYARRKRGDL